MKTDNELIAEFMGASYDAMSNSWTKTGMLNRGYFQESKPDGIEMAYSPNDLKYNTSWDWLMPVVEKIEILKINGFESEFCIKCNRCDLLVNINPKELRHNFGNCSFSSKIESVYRAVVEFIKWYNSQNSKPMKTEQTPKQEYIVEDNLIYQLHQVGWDKGSSRMSNRVWAQVYVDVAHGVNAEEAKQIAREFASAPILKALNNELLEALEESTIQIKYLHEKFVKSGGTGTGNAVISRNESIISKCKDL